MVITYWPFYHYNIVIEHGHILFTHGLAGKQHCDVQKKTYMGDFQWQCQITRGYVGSNILGKYPSKLSFYPLEKDDVYALSPQILQPVQQHFLLANHSVGPLNAMFVAS